MDTEAEPDPTDRTGSRVEKGATRTDLKRSAILEAATHIFLSQGYQGTTMDDIAAAAGVSKQTVYKQFGDKERLFADIVLGVTERAQAIVLTIGQLFDEIEDVEQGLVHLAHVYAAAVVSPQVIRLRRLVIGEADRFPDLAATYFDRAPRRGIEAIAAGMDRLVERRLLRIEDTGSAAVQFAYLVLGPLIDQGLFHPDSPATDDDIEGCAGDGVRVFVAAYS